MKKKLSLFFIVLIFLFSSTLYGLYGFVGFTGARLYDDKTASVTYYKAKNYTGKRTSIEIPKERAFKILILSDPLLLRKKIYQYFD